MGIELERDYHLHLKTLPASVASQHQFQSKEYENGLLHLPCLITELSCSRAYQGFLKKIVFSKLQEWSEIHSFTFSLPTRDFEHLLTSA